MSLVNYSFSLTGHKTKREKKTALIAEMQNMPTYEPVTRNYFADGLCVRECEMPKGFVGVGILYKKTHILTVSKGHMQIDLDDKLLDLKAPITIFVPAGTQKAIRALEDTVFSVSLGTQKITIAEVCNEFSDTDYSETLGQKNNVQTLNNGGMTWLFG